MSVLTKVSCVWPELQEGSESSGGVGLPLPLRAYQASPRNATLAGDLTYAHIARRSRFKKSYVVLNVEWAFKTDQYDLFQNFYFDTLGQGTSIFRIPLRYPENSGLTYWNVRFVSDYSVEWGDGRWMVKAQLDLVNKSYVSDISSVFGYQDYDVLIDDSSGADSNQKYKTRDGRIYTVREA